jgi:hypothetical protein
MRPYEELRKYLIKHPSIPAPDPSSGGFFSMGPLLIVASWDGGWDHVSVSHRNRCPTWSEMEMVKRTFFRDDETAMQLHVPPSDHVNRHKYCLHLWRPHLVDIPRPPIWMV